MRLSVPSDFDQAADQASTVDYLASSGLLPAVIEPRRSALLRLRDFPPALQLRMELLYDRRFRFG